MQKGGSQTQSESSGASLKALYLFCLAVEGLGISAKERKRKNMFSYAARN